MFVFFSPFQYSYYLVQAVRLIILTYVTPLHKNAHSSLLFFSHSLHLVFFFFSKYKEEFGGIWWLWCLLWELGFLVTGFIRKANCQWAPFSHLWTYSQPLQSLKYYLVFFVFFSNYFILQWIIHAATKSTHNAIVDVAFKMVSGPATIISKVVID